MRTVVALFIVALALVGAAWLRPAPLPAWQAGGAAEATSGAAQLSAVSAGASTVSLDAETFAGKPQALTSGDPHLVSAGTPSEPIESSAEPNTKPPDSGNLGVAPRIDPLTSTLCPEGMAWVSGEFCPAPPELMQGARCPVVPQNLGVCMDRYEYPNQPGALPAVMLRLDEAVQLCAAEGKRLCRESEWTHACRSIREPKACNLGANSPVRVIELWDPARVTTEVARNDGRWPSHPSACEDDFGVYDLIGNVQEWAETEMLNFAGALKGGRFNQPDATCDRSIHVNDKWTRYPHTGFRCCRDPLVPLPRQSESSRRVD